MSFPCPAQQHIKIYITNETLINSSKLQTGIFCATEVPENPLNCNFSDIKEKEYIEKIYDLIHKDDKLEQVINNKILNKIKDMKDNLILKIFTEFNFEDYEVDLISVLIKQMKSIYNKELTNALIQLEKIMFYLHNY